MFHQLLTPVGNSLLLSFLVAAIPIIVVLSLFRLAALKRPKDLPPPQADEWAASHDLQTPR